LQFRRFKSAFTIGAISFCHESCVLSCSYR
jgi:hypothetical protein